MLFFVPNLLIERQISRATNIMTSKLFAGHPCKEENKVCSLVLINNGTNKAMTPATIPIRKYHRL